MTDVSIILPCYRAAALALRSVEELSQYLERAALGTWEIIVVDDGGCDFPDRPWGERELVRLITLPYNRGKGAAVTAGMLAATGRVRIVTDVDLPYGTDLISVMVRYLRDRSFHLVIGDRTLPSSSYREALRWERRLASQLSAILVGRLVTGGFFDTQCGLKGIRGDVADRIFPIIQVERFAFDVELLYIALLHRLDIKRIPVRLRANQTSSVRVLRDCIQGTVDVLAIKYHQLCGHYESLSLQKLFEDEFHSTLNEELLFPLSRSPEEITV